MKKEYDKIIWSSAVRIKEFFEEMFSKQGVLDPSVIRPPSWRERQMQNTLIEKQYEESIKFSKKEECHLFYLKK